MKRYESLLASRLLEQAAEHFVEPYGCNDVPADLFAGLSPEEILDVRVRYSTWVRAQTGEPYGHQDGQYVVPLSRIGVANLMAYMASVIEAGSI